MTKRRASNEKLDEILRRPYTIEIEYGETPEEGVAAYVAEWPGCITAGATREEALARIGDAMRDWAAARLARRQRVAEPLKEYGGTIVTRLPRSLHRDAEKRAQHEGVSLNQWVATTLARAIGSPAELRRGKARARAGTRPRRRAS